MRLISYLEIEKRKNKRSDEEENEERELINLQ
jgi:hypothetical protein